MSFYRLLLHAYPASFRAEYGGEMCAAFARRRRDAGLFSLLLWIDAIFDVLSNASLVHLDILRQDLRYTARTLRRSPGFTATAVAVTAVGIGASTAAFTMLDHILIRPFPYAAEKDLVVLYEDHSLGRVRLGTRWDVAPANYRDWKRQATSFEGMSMYRGLAVNLVSDGEPRYVEGAAVAADMFPLLGATPVLGRVFTGADDLESATGTAVLSFSLWQGLFGGDAAVLGKKILLDNQPYDVIGVMPKDFYFPTREALLWTAMRFGPGIYEERDNNFVHGIARLRPGVSIENARAEMRSIAGQMAAAYPKELKNVGVTIIALRDDRVSDQSRLLLKALLGAAFCVLLIACTNVANLLLARALVRRKEMAVRAAIGAGRERVARQVLTESLVLALAGGACGVLLAKTSLPLLVNLLPVSVPLPEIPAIDLRVLAFGILVTCGTGIVFGLIPAWKVGRGQTVRDLRESVRSGGGRRERLRSTLVVAEVAGSVLLLVSCGLFLRALWRVQAVDPGFRTENVLTMRTSLPMPKYQERTPREQFYARVLSETSQLPGVEGAAYISFLPMVVRGGIWQIGVNSTAEEPTARRTASIRHVTPGFFSVLQIPMLRGRDVAESDTAESMPAAIVSESFVRRYWPGENPLGRHFQLAQIERTIVGVVGDIRVRGLEQTSEPQVYLPYKQHNNMTTWYAPKDLVVRAKGDAAALAPAIRRIIRAADPQQPVSDVRMLSEIVEGETASRRVQARVLGAFAAAAFLLAAIGIHGLLAFSVSSRTQELGVRMVLGAQPGGIVGMVLRDGIRLAAMGIALGAGLAYIAGRQLEALLAGVKPADGYTFAIAITLCMLMTLAGSLVPAWRAVRIDPASAIRGE